MYECEVVLYTKLKIIKKDKIWKEDEKPEKFGEYFHDDKKKVVVNKNGICIMYMLEGIMFVSLYIHRISYLDVCLYSVQSYV